MKKVLFFAIGVMLLGVVVYLGIRTSQDTSFVVWFGLATAILAPTAFAVISYSFRTDKLQLFQELAKVPEIDSLINKAKTQEEKIALLEQERNSLNEIIQVEARRQTLISTRDTLEQGIIRILKDYNAVVDELNHIDIKTEESPAVQEMKRIQERLKERRRGKIIVLRFGKREFIIPERKVSNSPPGILLLLGLRLAEKIQKRKERQMY